MRHDFLDRYSRLKSPIHRVSASLKLLVAFGFAVTVVSVPFRFPWFFLVALVFLLVIGFLSGIPRNFIVGRLLLLEPFAIGVAAMALFQHDGLNVFIGIVTKSTLCLFAMILTSNTTPFSEILRTMRQVKMPSLLVTILALAYRYLFVLIDEGERLQRARNSRTFMASQRKTWASRASLVGQMFVKSTERAERIYSAMASRGWK